MLTDKMPVLTVSGAPLERGRMIGEVLRQDIRTVLDKTKAAIEQGRGYDAEDYLAAFELYADYKTAISKWAPDLLQEVQGMAEGAAVTFDEMLRLQLLDEDWFFDAYHYRATARVHNKCTAFGVVGADDEVTYAGQNMDIMSLTEGHQVLLRIQYPDSDLESLVFTHAGLIGLCGMNNSPLGVNCNTLMQLGSCSDGLPVAFVTRSLLAMTSFDEAVLFLSKIKHAAGQNYTLSTGGKVGAFECSPQQVVEYRPRADGRKVVHTNHPLANDDTATYRKLAEADPGGSWVRGEGNTRSRLASIAARTLNNDKHIGITDLKSALGARDDPENPVCRDLSIDLPDGTSTNDSANPIAFTAGSMIYEYGEKSLLHLAAGPPSQSEFQVFEFTR